MDVAVIGFACRFPGDANNVENFWKFMCDKRTSVSDNTSRWNTEAFYSAKKELNASVTKRGHFLKQDIAAWDAKFFNISKAEAEAIDPQQRIFLEVVYEALENAGLPMDKIAGTRTGVFLGSFTNDYSELVHRDAEAAPSSIFTGTNSTSTSNRVSWFFDFKGPSITLNTACSSSLVALHLACQSLQTGDSDTAIVGGVNLLLNPDIFMQLSNQGFLARDGRCKSFDLSGDGYGRGDGFAAIVVRRAGDAIQFVDPLRAIIRATGCNQDGKTRGFTLPSADAQARLTEETYRKANLDYSNTLFVEAHGTGTQAGDTEETYGLAQTIAANRSPFQPLMIGSVKSNIGHLEGCAGMAGLIKTILILEKGVIPPTYGIERLNPRIRWLEWKLEVPTEITPWPCEGLRRISIQGFGYGGTNAHAIVDDAASYLSSLNIHQSSLYINGQSESAINHSTSRLYIISAQDRAGLRRVGKALGDHIEGLSTQATWNHNEEQHYLHRLAYTLAMRRSRLQWSAAVVASSATELSHELYGIQDSSGDRTSSHDVRIQFVFTGQGAQWPRMGHDLMAFGVYRDSVRAADRYLRQNLQCPWSAEEELMQEGERSRINEAEYSQPLCTILQIALVRLLRSWDIHPSAVVGHSSGEIAAAYCAGYLTQEDAWRIAYFRGFYCGQLRKIDTGLRGAMMVVNANFPQIGDLGIKPSKGDVCVACINSPSNITFAGDEDAIEELITSYQALGVSTQKILVDTAYHSPHMQAVAHDYMESITNIIPLQGRIDCTLFSTVFGDVAVSSKLGSSYWVRNLLCPVRFFEAITKMLATDHSSIAAKQDSIGTIVEIGPHGAMSPSIMEIMQAQNLRGVEYTSALKRGASGITSVLHCAGKLFTMGAPVNLAALNGMQSYQVKPLTELPAYQWNHSHSFLWESRLDKEFRARSHPQLPLLGAPQPSFAENERIWRGFLRAKEKPWIKDHVIQGDVLYPAAGFLTMAIEAVIRQPDFNANFKSIIMRDIEIISALKISENVDPEIVVVLRPHTDRTWLEFTISSSINPGPLRRNCKGLIRTEHTLAGEISMTQSSQTLKGAPISAHYLEEKFKTSKKTRKSFYSLLSKAGLQYGREFSRVGDIEYFSNYGFAEMKIGILGLEGNEQEARPHIIHPATLDAIFHLAFAAIFSERGHLENAMVPTRIGMLIVATDIAWEKDTPLFVSAKVVETVQRNTNVDIEVLNGQRTILQLGIKGMTLTEIPRAASGPATEKNAERTPLCYNLAWRPVLGALSNVQLKNHLKKSIHSLQGVHVGNAIKSIAGVVTEYICLLQHYSAKKTPISVLEIDVNCSKTDEPLLIPQSEEFHRVSKFSRYQAAVPNSERFAWLQDHSSSLSIQRADIQRKSSNNFFEHQLDLVVLVSSAAMSKTNFNHTLKNSVNGLTKEGHLIFIDTSGNTSNPSAFAKHGLEMDVKIEVPEKGKSDIILILGSRFKSQSKIPTAITILEASCPDKRAIDAAEKAIEWFKNHDISAERLCWSETIRLPVGKPCLSLVELNGPLLETIGTLDFTRLQSVLTSNTEMIWASLDDDPSGSLVCGLVRTIHNEIANAQCRSLRLDNNSLRDIGSLIWRLLSSNCQDIELRVVESVIHSSRVEPDSALNDELFASLDDQTKHLTMSMLRRLSMPAKLDLQNISNSATLYFEPELSYEEPLPTGHVEMEVRASGPWTRSITATTASSLFFECTGVVRRVATGVQNFKAGDLIATYGRGPHRNIYRAPANHCQSIPDGSNFEAAATVLSTYGTAWYGFMKVAKAEPGQIVLINAPFDGMAQSAIRLAQYMGLVPYVTIDANEDRHRIYDEINLPKLTMITASDGFFARAVLKATNGKKVDIVLDAFSSRKSISESWSCLNTYGTFLAISPPDGRSLTPFDLAPFHTGIVYAYYNWSHIATKRPEKLEQIANEVFLLLRQGFIELIVPSQSLSVSKAISALQSRRQDIYIDRKVLTWAPDDRVPCASFTKDTQILDPEGVYVLVGGLGGIGRSLSLLLVEMGARKLCFISRSGVVSKAAETFLTRLDQMKVQAISYRCDVGEVKQIRETLTNCQSSLGGSVRGVLQAAMFLQDAIFTNMSQQQWTDSLRPKVQGTRNLHRALPPNLDFFILLSSFAGVFGNRGQANYAAACNFQDAFAHFRRAQGQKAVSIDLGIIRDVGALAETEGNNKLRLWEEKFGIREKELHQLMRLVIEKEINGHEGNMSAHQIVTGFATAADFQRVGLETPYYFNESRFSLLATIVSPVLESNRTNLGSENSQQASIATSESFEDAVEVVSHAIVGWLAMKLETPVTEIDTTRPVHTYGVDSLLAIEITQWVFRRFRAVITVFELLAAAPITSLARAIAQKSDDLPATLR